MDITGLAPWLIEIVKAQKNVDRGSVDLQLLKNLGEVVGIRTKHNRVISFNKGDNREAMVVVADVIAGLGESDCQFDLSFKVRKGKIRKLVISTEDQKRLDQNSEVRYNEVK